MSAPVEVGWMTRRNFQRLLFGLYERGPQVWYARDEGRTRLFTLPQFLDIRLLATRMISNWFCADNRTDHEIISYKPQLVECHLAPEKMFSLVHEKGKHYGTREHLLFFVMSGILKYNTPSFLMISLLRDDSHLTKNIYIGPSQLIYICKKKKSIMKLYY